MSTERDRRISDLFHEALERAPEDRSAFLRHAAADDEQLRLEVASLLDSRGLTSPLLESPADETSLAPDTSSSDLTGRAIGPYQVLAPLGAGGMGVVYRAHDRRLGRDVAIKLLPPAVADHPERRARFAREARLLATLHHPHIGVIHGLEDLEDGAALVLELVEGPTLAERLEHGPLPLPLALVTARQIADALNAAHQRHIVHRDLKPANIVLRGLAGRTKSPSVDPQVKVLDFGLAKTAVETGPTEGTAEGGQPTATAAGRILGSPAYMSPEQARGEAVDKRTDIWAFGCVLYEMLTGRRAFEGATISDTIVCVLEREPDWSALPADTPPAVRTLLARCLRKDPDRRLHDIADARIELEDVPRDHRDATAGPRGDTRRRTRAPLAWLTAVALALAAVIGGIGAWNARHATPATGPIARLEIPPPPGWSLQMPLGMSPFTAVSPDGRRVATVLRQDNGERWLWVRALDEAEPVMIRDTKGALGPFWSPDSQRIGFFADGRLKAVGLDGNDAVTICPAPGYWYGGTWNRDGVILFTTTELRELRKVQVATSNEATASTATIPLGDDTRHMLPQFLPDGRHFLFVADRNDNGTIKPFWRVGQLAAEATVPFAEVVESYATFAAGHLLFARQGVLVAQPFDLERLRFTGPTRELAKLPRGLGIVSASDAGVVSYTLAPPGLRNRLIWRGRDGASYGHVGDPSSNPNVRLSPDNRRLAVSRGNTVWIVDLARGGMGAPLVTQRSDADPTWSPDGSQILFNRFSASGKWQLFVRPSDFSGQPERLLPDWDGDSKQADWSRDGRHVAFAGEGGHIWIVDLSGTRTPMPLREESFTDLEPSFSPDGRWLAYSSNRSGRSEVYVTPFPKTGPEYPVSVDGGWGARWRGDSGELYFLSPDGRMMAAKIDITHGFQAAVPEALFQTTWTLGNDRRVFDVNTAGDRFIYAETVDEPATEAVHVIVNWPALLAPEAR